MYVFFTTRFAAPAPSADRRRHGAVTFFAIESVQTVRAHISGVTSTEDGNFQLVVVCRPPARAETRRRRAYRATCSLNSYAHVLRDHGSLSVFKRELGCQLTVRTFTPLFSGGATPLVDVGDIRGGRRSSWRVSTLYRSAARDVVAVCMNRATSRRTPRRRRRGGRAAEGARSRRPPSVIAVFRLVVA
ncbi:hypothetical protein EVAR_51492_1 [Eumeta japonica]|uniref:Uncharacterized protein n=1 Tax=Eumeta variegata TaxID=151549 RepID=A0A4C1XF50_EUMVA|nr:hypothetical protein EVAR_51492_1 [Eumeta japonica]